MLRIVFQSRVQYQQAEKKCQLIDESERNRHRCVQTKELHGRYCCNATDEERHGVWKGEQMKVKVPLFSTHQ